MIMKKFLFALWVALLLPLSVVSARTIDIKGSVKDSEGRAVVGAVVSDGVQCVRTAGNGRFRMKSDSDVSRTVFVVVPSEYEIPVDRYGKFSSYVLIDGERDAQRADFTLVRRSEPCGHYFMIYEGDPQAMSSRPHSIESWKWVSSALAQYRGTFELPVYHTILGDMVTNEIEVPGRAGDFLSGLEKTGLSTFCLPGNHDHIRSAANFKDATAGYVKYFGPYNYAANIGQVHYVFLDDCAWDKEYGKHSYCIGFNDETLAFLESDLAFVPKDVPVVISTHCPVTKTFNAGFPKKVLNYDKFIGLLQGRNVNLWYGHTHIYSTYPYTDVELAEHAPGVASIESHVVGRVGGAWSCSGEITMDGSPRGVVVMEVDGKNISWFFHSLDPEYMDDMNVYVPGTVGPDREAVYCNVFFWDPLWETPRWYEDGEQKGIMSKCTEDRDACNDPLYVYMYERWEKEGRIGERKEPSKPTYCNHLFKIVPSAGVRSGEIRFKDRFGGEHSYKVSW